jgi:hypothetical protein
MPESSPNTASSPGAQATDRLYTADEVRVLMADAWELGYATPRYGVERPRGLDDERAADVDFALRQADGR